MLKTLGLASAATLLFGAGLRAQDNVSTGSQAPPQPGGATTSLAAEELKLMRMELRAFFQFSIRAQVLCERIRMDEQRIDRITSDRENTLAQMAEILMLSKQQAEVSASLEKRLVSELNVDQRIDLEREIKIAGLSQESVNAREQHLNDRLAAQARDMAQAEARIASALSELELLQKALAPNPTK